MSDASESGNIDESFVEDENKVKIEATIVNFGCVKNEPSERVDFENNSHTTQYRITVEYENIFGKPSHQLKIEEDSDNLIGFLDNDVIMENAMIKLEAVKEEDDGSSSNFYCSKCKGIYKGYCLKCSTLLWILNNTIVVKSKSNTLPTDILEIRETSIGRGVYLLRTVPINIIFGPFEGISGIESTVGHSWKIINNKLRNIKSGNWMKNIFCAASALLRNLDIFQIDGILYFQTNREITEGEELLIYYDGEALQQLDNSEECLYTPNKQEKLPKIFACTMCCLGFGSNKCLMEHKGKCRVEHSRGRKDFVFVECHYCKMWLEKWEHEEHHVAYCLEKHHRMCRGYSEGVDRSDADVEEMDDDCGTRAGKRRYQRDICSRRKNRRDDLQSDRKDYQGFSGGNHGARLHALAESSNNEQIQNTVETNDSQNLLNKHRSNKSFTCDICMKTFTQKGHLKTHIRNKHTDDGGGVKDYKCSECAYQTNYKPDLQKHLNKHRGIVFRCDTCMVNFTQKDNLARHIKNKHKDRSVNDYKCLECSFASNYKYALQKHLNKHKGIKPFTCDICMAKFTEKAHLKTHIKNKHADNGNAKDYKCSECSYQTNDKGNLQRHLNKHKGIKPFTCDICKAKYTRKYHLKSHIINKHTDDATDKAYKCSECPFQTNVKIHFQNHLNTHKGIKAFQCDICMMQYTRKDSLTRHLKGKHTDDGSAKG